MQMQTLRLSIIKMLNEDLGHPDGAMIFDVLKKRNQNLAWIITKSGSLRDGTIT